jgi:hypothetical protein
LYKRKAIEADRFARDLEAAGISGDMKTQQLIDQLKDKYVLAVAQLEARLRNEIDLVNSFTQKQRYFSESSNGTLKYLMI